MLHDPLVVGPSSIKRDYWRHQIWHHDTAPKGSSRSRYGRRQRILIAQMHMPIIRLYERQLIHANPWFSEFQMRSLAA
jgi:hypothetical protein